MDRRIRGLKEAGAVSGGIRADFNGNEIRGCVGDRRVVGDGSIGEAVWTRTCAPNRRNGGVANERLEGQVARFEIEVRVDQLRALVRHE